MMGLGVEVETGVCVCVWACSTLCVPDSHPVSCKHISPGMGGAFTSGFHGELNGLMDAV
jgi:hypothetical protein